MLGKGHLFFVGIFCFAAVFGPAFADDVTLEAARDNTLFSTVSNNSSGSGPAVFCGRTASHGGGIKQRGVLMFDVGSSVPAGAVITDVTLTMTLSAAGGPDRPVTISIHRLLADWGEGGSSSFGGQGVPAMPGDATWRHRFFPDQFWSTEGGDFDPLPRSLQDVGKGLGPYDWTSTPELIADVQQWLDDPAQNFGWLMLGDESQFATARKFHSRESFTPAFRPMLTISYELPPPCPYDLNGDGIVNARDIVQVAHALRDRGDVAEDLDGDGVVTPRDLKLVIRNFGLCP